MGLTYNVEFPAKIETKGTLPLPEGIRKASNGDVTFHVATYGNRRFSTFVTPHTQGASPTTAAEITEWINTVNTAGATSQHLRIVNRKKTTILGGQGEIVEAVAQDAP